MGGGIDTALALALAEAEAGEGAEAEADLFGEAVAPMIASPERAGPKGGRPKGARNRSTEEWRRYLLSKYPSPLETLLALTTRRPEDLARELGLYRWSDGVLLRDDRDQPVLATGEALKVIVDAAAAALPYMHQRQPLAVETRGDGRALLVFGDLTQIVQGGPEAGGIPFAPIKQNQGVIEGELAKSDVYKSDGQ